MLDAWNIKQSVKWYTIIFIISTIGNDTELYHFETINICMEIIINQKINNGVLVDHVWGNALIPSSFINITCSIIGNKEAIIKTDNYGGFVGQ